MVGRSCRRQRRRRFRRFRLRGSRVILEESGGGGGRGTRAGDGERAAESIMPYLWIYAMYGYGWRRGKAVGERTEMADPGYLPLLFAAGLFLTSSPPGGTRDKGGAGRE